MSTLFDVANHLRPFRDRLTAATDTAHAAELKDLDGLVRALLATVQELHKAGRSFGLLHPLNICWHKPASGAAMLLLPDVGFSLVQGAGSVPGWLDKGATEVLQRYQAKRKAEPTTPDDWARLFRAAWYAGREFSLAELNVQREVKIVARILEWVLTGAVRTDDMVAPEDEQLARTPAYEAIRDAILGKIKSVSKLFERLVSATANKVAQAYLKPSELDPEKAHSGSRRGWVAVAGVATLAAVVGGAIYFVHQYGPNGNGGTNGNGGPTPPPPVVPLCSDCPPESKLIEPLKELDEVWKTAKPDPRAALKGRLPAMLTPLEKVGKVLPKENPDPKEAECFKKLIRDVNEELDRAFVKFLVAVEEPDSSILIEDAVAEAKVAMSLKTRLESLAGKEQLTWTKNMIERLTQLAAVAR